MLSRMYEPYTIIEFLSDYHIDRDIIVGYQGIPGAYSQIAINVFFSNVKKTSFAGFFDNILKDENISTLNPANEQKKIRCMPYNNFEAAFSGLKNLEVDMIAIPIENTLGGCLYVNYDLLFTHRNDICVVGEYDLKVEHNLICVNLNEQCYTTINDCLNDIKLVVSHKQALAQCRNFISSELVNAQIFEFYDTAGSARFLKLLENREKLGETSFSGLDYETSQLLHYCNCKNLRAKNIAIIASKIAASNYDLKIIKEGIEDFSSNFTRFLYITRKNNSHKIQCNLSDVETSESIHLTNTLLSWSLYKTILIFHIDNTKGALLKILQLIDEQNASLSKLESRPIPAELLQSMSEIHSSKFQSINHQYIFYADIVSDDPKKLQNLFKILQNTATIFTMSIGFFPLIENTEKKEKTENFENNETAENYTTIIPTKSIVYMGKTVALIGLGAFGSFLAKRILQANSISCVIGIDIQSELSEKQKNLFAPYNKRFQYIGNSNYYELLNNLCNLDVIIFSCSISSFESVISTFPFIELGEKLNNDLPLIVDVLSVKEYSKKLFTKYIPNGFPCICVHPLFGPSTGNGSWKGLNLMYSIQKNINENKINHFLNFFSIQGCRLISMSCIEHDRIIAKTQFLSHFVGRVLMNNKVPPATIDTSTYSDLRKLVKTINSDSIELFLSMYKYNDQVPRELDAFLVSLYQVLDLLWSNNPMLNISVKQNPTKLANNSNIFSINAKNISLSSTVSVYEKYVREKKLYEENKQENKKLKPLSLCVGEPHYDPPNIVKTAIMHAAIKSTKYTSVRGSPLLLKLISEYLKKLRNVDNYDENSICVTNGAKQAIYQTVFSLCGPGDEVLIILPAWSSYSEITRMCGATPVFIHTREQDEYKLTDRLLIENINKNTKLIIISNPSNPLGIFYTHNEIKNILNIINNSQCYILADEIYDLTFHAEVINENIENKENFEYFKFDTIPSFAEGGCPEKTLLIGGFSKNFSVTGLRIGFLAAPAFIVDRVAQIQSHICTCASSLSQHAIEVLLSTLLCKPELLHLRDSQQDIISWLCKNSHENAIKKKICTDVLNKHQNLVSFINSKATFYLWINVSHVCAKMKMKTSTELAEFLMENYKVAVTPGLAFGNPNFIRISFASKIHEVREAMLRLSHFLSV